VLLTEVTNRNSEQPVMILETIVIFCVSKRQRIGNFASPYVTILGRSGPLLQAKNFIPAERKSNLDHDRLLGFAICDLSTEHFDLEGQKT
jgi:hypothetical protein